MGTQGKIPFFYAFIDKFHDKALCFLGSAVPEAIALQIVRINAGLQRAIRRKQAENFTRVMLGQITGRFRQHI